MAGNIDPKAVADNFKRAFEAYNRHDAAGYVMVLALDAVVHDPFSPQPMTGRETNRIATERLWKGFPDAKIRLERLLIEDDIVAGEVVSSGTNTGPMEGPGGVLPPTNRFVEFPGAFFARLNSEGLVQEGHRYYDTMAMLKALGLVPPPPGGK